MITWNKPRRPRAARVRTDAQLVAIAILILIGALAAHALLTALGAHL